MKDILCIALLCLSSIAGAAQKVGREDSVRTIELQEVQVTARSREQGQRLLHFFRANRSATTEEVLARLPELSLIRRGSYGMEPVIRSYHGGQINLLIDGMRIHGACTDRMDPASIYVEPQNLERIEVKTPGNSLLSGSSVGGSINLKLAGASCHEEARLSGMVSSGYQSAAGAVYESLNLDYAGVKWGLKATGTYRKGGNYRDGSGREVPFSRYEKANVSLGGKLKLSDHLHLSAHLLADDGWNLGYPALPMDVGYAAARIASVGIVRESRAHRWQRLEGKLYANQVRHSMDDTHRPFAAVHMDMPGESVTWGAYAEGLRPVMGRHPLQVKADVALTALKASMTMYGAGQSPMFMLTWPDNRQLQGGLSARYLYALDSSTQLQFSARGDVSHFFLTSQMGKDQLEVFGYTHTTRSFFLPSLSLQLTRKLPWRLKAALSVTANGRAPTASELYGVYLFSAFDGYDYLGSPELRQERGLQAEGTLAWNAAKWTLQATGHLSRISNFILGEHAPGLSVMTMGARGVKTYRNTTFALVGGGEASAVYTPFSKTQVVSTLKYVYGRESGGLPLPMITPLRSTCSIRQQAGRFWLQAELEAAAAQNRVSPAAGEQATGAFSLWHLRGGYKGILKHSSWQLSGGVENLLDSYYREHLDWGRMARPGRSLFLQATVSF